MQPSELDSIAARPRRYWNSDGIPELAFGATSILWALLVFISDWIRRAYNPSYLGVLIPVCMVAIGISAATATKRLKARWTEPRTGHVVLRTPNARKILPALLGAWAGAGAIQVLVHNLLSHALERFAAPTLAVLAGAGFLIPSWRNGPMQMRWAGITLLVLAPVLLLADGPFIVGATILLAAGGLVFLTFGLHRLLAYVRNHPLPGGSSL
jgi:hypothetical protein